VQPIQLRIARKGKEDESRAAITAIFDSLPRRVHGRKEIEKLFRDHRRAWHLLSSTTSSDLIEYLATLHMTTINLTGPLRRARFPIDRCSRECSARYHRLSANPGRKRRARRVIARL